MKTIWIGVIDSIFGYGIAVAEVTEEKCMEALKDIYNASVEDLSYEYDEQYDDNGIEMSRFEKAMEYWGGSVSEVELGKGYDDGFR
tara:strand:+ start:2186 stop:2443 length:258 start_codon:yes stop_codon:yes gene_type:complete